MLREKSANEGDSWYRVSDRRGRDCRVSIHWTLKVGIFGGRLTRRIVRLPMADEDSRPCVECDGMMSPIVIMDKSQPGLTRHRHAGSLEYRLPEDRVSFW